MTELEHTANEEARHGNREALEAAHARIAELEQGYEKAYKYALHFAECFVAEHSDNGGSGWRAEGDLLGLLMQIDNATTVARTYRSRIAELEAERDTAWNAALEAAAGVARTWREFGHDYDLEEELRALKKKEGEDG